MSRFIMKYNVKARGREGLDNTWIIKNLDNGEEILTNHIEIKCKISTNERVYDDGFGMYVENGKIEIREHPSIGKYAVITESE